MGEYISKWKLAMQHNIMNVHFCSLEWLSYVFSKFSNYDHISTTIADVNI